MLSKLRTWFFLKEFEPSFQLTNDYFAFVKNYNNKYTISIIITEGLGDNKLHITFTIAKLGTLNWVFQDFARNEIELEKILNKADKVLAI